MSIHDTYEKEGAARRYVMNEMTAQEQSAFEAHYFDCLTCGDEVIEWTQFVESGRAAANVTPFRPRRTLTTWIPSAAAAALVVVAGYQQVAIQGLRAVASRMDKVPQIVETPVRGLSRDADPHVEQIEKDRSAVFPVDVPDRAAYESLRARVLKGDDVVQRDLDIVKVENGVFHVLVRPLPAGRYTLTVEGAKRERIEKVAAVSIDVR